MRESAIECEKSGLDLGERRVEESWSKGMGDIYLFYAPLAGQVIVLGSWQADANENVTGNRNLSRALK